MQSFGLSLVAGTPSASGAALVPRGADACADEDALHLERSRLVRFCARITGDVDAGEDLAQETLLAAHRGADSISQPDRRWQWLASTARHLSVDWVRRRSRERRRFAQPAPPPSLDSVEDGGGTPEALPADVDLALELERADLASLLDRAMALLPVETRRVLLERLVEETPQAQVALRLGLTEGAVEARLHRGKLALRRILAGPLREEAAAYGLVDPERQEWSATRIWCPTCGVRRLWGRFGPGGYLHVVCRGCFGRREYCMTEGRFGSLLDGVKGYGPAYNRVVKDFHEAFRNGIGGRIVPCPRCGTGSALEVSPGAGAAYRELRRACPHCGPVSGPGSVAGLTSSTPEGRAFWRSHRRVRTLPEREISSCDGAPALLSAMESVTGGARLEVVYARDTLKVLAINVP